MYGIREICWFENGKNGPVLVRPDGQRRAWEDDNDCPDLFRTEYAKLGWQRAILYMREFNIWDATAFGCTMQTALLVTLRNKQALIFEAPQFVEKNPQRFLTKSNIETIQENLRAFYSDPNLQASMNCVILHGVALHYDGSSIRPIDMNQAKKLLATKWPLTENDFTPVRMDSVESVKKTIAMREW